MNAIVPLNCDRRTRRFVTGLLEQLRDSFGINFEIWMQFAVSNGHTWECLSLPRSAVEAELLAEDGTLLTQVLDSAAYNGTAPVTQRCQDDRLLVCVPFQTTDGTRMAACGFLNISPENAVARLSELCGSLIQYLALEREMTAQYNFEAATAMEAAGAVQKIAYQIRECSGIEKWAELTRTALADLRYAIRAQTLCFLPNPSAPQAANLQLLIDGPELITQQECSRLVKTSTDGCRLPLVRNHIGGKLHDHPFPNIQSWLIVQVFPPEQIGWLIAVNKQSQVPDNVMLPDPNHFEFGTPDAGLMTTAGSLLAAAIHRAHNGS